MKRTLWAVLALTMVSAHAHATPKKAVIHRLHDAVTNYEFTGDTQNPGARLHASVQSDKHLGELVGKITPQKLKQLNLKKLPLVDRLRAPSLASPIEKNKWNVFSLRIGKVAGVDLGTTHVMVRKQDGAVQFVSHSKMTRDEKYGMK